MFVLALLVGLAVAIVAWSIASWFLVQFIVRSEQRADGTQTRFPAIGEAVLCGALVLVCFALAIWIASLISS
ncbi:MAG TPA: hypothetical protein VI756_23975 [Blastocatellia bacterium]